MNDFDRANPRDDAFRALAHPLRREVLCELVEIDDEVVTVAKLSDRLASRLEGATPDQVGRNLHHIHLPKLEALGVLEYDGRSKTVRYRGSPHVTALLETGLVGCR